MLEMDGLGDLVREAGICQVPTIDTNAQHNC